MRNASRLRSEVLEGAPLDYAPENELGVVFLFAHLARRWRLKIHAIRSGFPDCIAYQKIQGQEKQVRIEFEHRSRNFKTHGHDAAKCDWLVCWEHNWASSPRSLRIVELRREFGLGFNVWIMPCSGRFKEILEGANSSDRWSLPSQRHQGDLILFYFTSPERHIAHVFLATDRCRKCKAGWKDGMDYMGPIRRVCRLGAPVFFEDLRRDRVLSRSHFVRAQMQGRPNATEYWPYLYELIVRRNPKAKTPLRRFAPGNLP